MSERQTKLLAMAEDLLTTGGEVARAVALVDLAREIRLSEWTPAPKSSRPVKASGNGGREPAKGGRDDFPA